jgi:hypothetical protein
MPPKIDGLKAIKKHTIFGGLCGKPQEKAFIDANSVV